jgi:hypothetical protein
VAACGRIGEAVQERVAAGSAGRDRERARGRRREPMGGGTGGSGCGLGGRRDRVTECRRACAGRGRWGEDCGADRTRETGRHDGHFSGRVHVVWAIGTRPIAV